MDEAWTVLRGGQRRAKLSGGRALRILSAMEVLEAHREAEALLRDGRERALCANACLLARALEQGEKPIFEDGEAVLRRLSPAEIGDLARQWGDLSRRENPSPEDGEGRLEALKKAWGTRLMRAFSGVCSWLLVHCPPRRGPGR